MSLANELFALPDVASDTPAGDDLEHDGDFGDLERAARGRTEQQHGDLIVAAEEPDWTEVTALATGLLTRTHDLRVLAHLAVARLQTDGLAGYASVLGTTRHELDTRWALVHPLLDPEDDNDPTLRANALLALASPGRVLRVLRDMPLAISVRAGRVCWRDIGMALGAIEVPADREKPSEAMIHAAFQETDTARLSVLEEAASAAIAHAAGISTSFDTHAGAGTGPDLTELIKLLGEIRRYVAQYRPVAVPVAEAAPADEHGVSPVSGAASSVVTAASLGPVTTRTDAMRLLDLVSAYYERYEPSSPLPLMLERARRLADKNFIDILRDMAPQGLGQAQIVIGVREE